MISRPVFSIVVPTHARPRQLHACLSALAALDYPRRRFEVIVVDDGSEAPPEEIVERFGDRIDIRLVTQSHAGPAAARNTGARWARGEFLAFTDDDCAPAPDWLTELAARFAIAPDHALGGRTLNGLPENPFSSASQLLIGYLYAYYNDDPEEARFFTSNNMALPAEAFHEIGGFDTSFPRAAAEDRELCDRWLHHGRRMCYVPEAVVHHAHALTFRSFWHQHLNYGRQAFYFHRVHARRSQTKIRLEPPSFYLSLLRHPFAEEGGRRAPLLATLMGMSQMATAAGFFWEGTSAS